MSQVQGKYLRDENDNIFSPIVSSDSVIYNGGGLLEPKTLVDVTDSTHNIRTRIYSLNKLIIVRIYSTDITGSIPVGRTLQLCTSYGSTKAY